MISWPSTFGLSSACGPSDELEDMELKKKRLVCNIGNGIME